MHTKVIVRHRGHPRSRGVRHGLLFDINFRNVAESKQNKLKLWHERLGHVNFRAVVNTSKLLAYCGFCFEKDSEFLA